jgi:hypothetical protein
VAILFFLGGVENLNYFSNFVSLVIILKLTQLNFGFFFFKIKFSGKKRLKMIFYRASLDPENYFYLQRKSHYNYRDDFALEKFEKVKILVYHICPQKWIKTIFRSKESQKNHF